VSSWGAGWPGVQRSSDGNLDHHGRGHASHSPESPLATKGRQPADRSRSSAPASGVEIAAVAVAVAVAVAGHSFEEVVWFVF
jgi:hypothetical protein